MRNNEIIRSLMSALALVTIVVVVAGSVPFHSKSNKSEWDLNKNLLSHVFDLRART